MHVLYSNVSEYNSKGVSVGGKCILRGNVPITSIVHSPNSEIHFEIILIRVANCADVASEQQLDVHHWVLQRFYCSNGPFLYFYISYHENGLTKSWENEEET